MENVLDILTKFKDKGIRIGLDSSNANLSIKGSIANLNDADKAVLRENKELLLSFLKEQQTVVIPKNAFNEGDQLLLSPNQKAIWLHTRMEENDTMYLVPAVYSFRIPGLKKELLTTATESLVAEHQILSFIFEENQGEPYQKARVFKVENHLFFEDLSKFSEAEKRTKYQAIINDSMQQGFDINQRPPWSITVIDLGKDNYLFFVKIHHLISDGTTLGLLFDNLIEAYTMQESNAVYSYKGLQYHDYARWIENRENHQASKTFWTRYLEGHSEDFEFISLPPVVEKAVNPVVELDLDATIQKQLTALTKEYQLTTSHIISFAFGFVLSKYGRQDDLIIGIPAEGRTQGDLSKVIGDLVNTIPLRLSLDYSNSTLENIQTFGKGFLSVLSHQSYPFQYILEDIEYQRLANRHPLFNAIVSFPNGQDLGKKNEDEIKIARKNAMYDLTLSVIEMEGSTLLQLEFETATFTEEFSEQLLNQVKIVLEQLLNAPHLPLSDLTLLSDDQQQKATQEDLSVAETISTATVLDTFLRHNEKKDHAIAVVETDRNYTYAELLQRSESIALKLQQVGIKKGDRVIVALDSSANLVASMFAIWMCRAVYVPVGDKLPVSRIEEIKNDSQAKFTIDSPFFQELPENTTAMEKPSPDDLAYILYTSGSTGKPKGVMISHGALATKMEEVAALLKLEPFRTFTLTSPTFDVALLELVLPLTFGGTIVISEKKPNSDVYKQVIAADVSILQGTPTYFSHFESELDNETAARLNDTLKILCLGGESLNDALVQRLKKKLPNVQINNHYGPTETTIDALVKEDINTFKRNSLGTPIGSTLITIVDNQGKILPKYVPGELLISGPCLADGYWNLENESREKFAKNGALNKNVYKSGDLVVLNSDGEVEFLGRIDQQVKVNGHRIELDEVNAKLRSIEGISDAHTQLIDGTLISWITPEQEDTKYIRESLKSLVPDYMVPNMFLGMRILPTKNGKVDAKELIANLQMDTVDNQLLPTTAEEKQIVEIWRSVLNQDAIHLRSNFFAIGGHSLHLLRLKSDYQKNFQADISIKELFLYTTPEEHLRLISSAPEAVVAILKSPEKETYVTTPFQEVVWYASLTDEGSKAYNVYTYTDIPKGTKIGDVQVAVEKLSHRIDAFNTNFEISEEGSIVQRIAPRAIEQIEIEELDLASEHSDELIQQKVKRRFDLEKECLFRFYLVSQTDGTLFLLTVANHIVCDTDSLTTIEDQIKAVLKNSELSNLSEEAIDYKDYAEWLHQKMDTGGFEEAASYWKNLLHGDLPRLDFSDQKIKGQKNATGKAVSFEINPKLFLQLQASKVESGASDFTLFYTLWNILLSKYSNESDLIIGTPVSVRNRTELRDVVGYFLNTVPLRSKLNAKDTFNQTLATFHQQVIEGLHNGDYPFLSILRDIKYKTEIGQTPLFDVFYTFQQVNVLPEVAIDHTYMHHDGIHSKFDFDINMMHKDGRVHCMISYNNGRYSDALVKNISDSFQQLIQELAESPNMKVNQLFRSDRKKVEKKEVTNSSIVSQFVETALKHPDQVAVKDAIRSYTYAELNDLTDQFATTLIDRYQLSVDDRVSVQMEHTALIPLVFLAIKKIGAVYVPIDSKTPKERTDYIVKDSESKLLINDEVAENILQITGDKRTHPIPAIRENATEFIIYTSGSTGFPKGILLSQKSVNNRLSWMWNTYPFEANEVACSKTSISFVDHIGEIFGPLLKGVPTVYFTKDEVLNVESFIDSLSQKNISRLVLVPSLLKALLVYSEACYSKLKSLKFWVCSGEALEEDTVINFYKTLKCSDVRLLNVYGSTEVTADATYYDTAEKYNPYYQFGLFSTKNIEKVDGFVDKLITRTTIHNGKELLSNTRSFEDVDFKNSVSSEEYFSDLNTSLIDGSINVAQHRYIGHMTGPMPPLFREVGRIVNELNQNLVKIETSGVLTFIERQMIGMFHQLVFEKGKAFYDENVQHSESCLGVVTNGGTLSNLTAMSVALNNAFPVTDNFGGIAREGLLKALRYSGYSDVALLGSSWCHYSISKSLKTLGLGLNAFHELVYDGKTEEEIRSELSDLIHALQEKNVLVLAVIGVAGTTESGKVEPLNILGDIANKHGVHYHVDAAFGGGFLADPQLKSKLSGIEKADTVTLCAHKQYYLPVGLSYCLFKSTSLIGQFENNTEYQARKGSFDLGRYTLEGSRNFNSLYIHAAMSICGLPEYAKLVHHNYNNAQYLASLIEEDEAFELKEKPDLNILLFRYVPDFYKDSKNENVEEINRANEQLQREQFAQGNTFVSFTKVRNHTSGKKETWLRCVLMNPFTRREDIVAVLNDQKKILSKMEGIHLPMVASSGSKQVPIGGPLQNVAVYILDEEGNEVPTGVKGEICVAGDCLSLGYLNLESETEARFIQFGENRLFKTGDFGKLLPEGDIVYLGRKDHQVKINGLRVELSEIQEVTRDFSGVSDAVVTLLEKEEAKFLVCYLIGASVDEAALIEYWSSRLPDYMIPKSIVKLEAFPLNASGKVDYKSLPDVDCKPDGITSEFTEREAQIKQIWEDILEVEVAHKDQDFLKLGGHSLIIGQLLSRYKKAFKRSIPIHDLFAERTIRKHAALILQAEDSEIDKIELAPEMEDYPVSLNQFSLYPLAKNREAKNAYNMCYGVRVNQVIDKVHFEQALESLISRHEILRTSLVYNSSKEEVRQTVHNDLSREDCLVYLEGIDDAQVFVATINSKEHKLEANCLWSVYLQNNDTTSLFGVNMHHLISDGWSMEIFIRDLFDLYLTKVDATYRSSLPKLSVQYKDFAYQLGKKDHSVDLNYWVNQFKNGVPTLELPINNSRPSIKTYNGRDVTGFLDDEIFQSIQEIADKEETTLFVLLTSLIQGFLYKYTGQTEMVIGAPFSGRGQSELQDQIGFFVKTLPLKFEINPAATISELVQTTQEVVLNGMKHSDFNLLDLQEELKLQTDLSRSPLFDVLVVLQNKKHAVSNSELSNNLDISFLNSENNFSKYDISFIFNEAEDGILYAFEYNTDLFEEAFMEEMSGLFQVFVKSFVQSKARLNEQCLLDTLYRNRLSSFNRTDQTLQLKQLGEELVKAMIKNQGKDALHFEDSNYSYDTLIIEIGKYVNVLRERDIDQQSTVAVCIERSADSALIMVATLMLGACYVPIDMSLPLDRINYILEDSMANAIIVDDSSQGQILTMGKHIHVNELKEGVYSDALESNNVDPSKNSFLIYTSGSTGKPKGVSQTYRTLLNLMDWNLNNSGLPHQVKSLSFSSFSFDSSINDILYTFLSGGTVYLASERYRKNFQLLKTWLLNNEVESLSLPYSALKGFFEEFDKNELQGNKIKTIISTGEQLYISGGLRRFLVSNPEVVIHNFYGPSETHVVTATKFSAADNLPIKAAIGKAIINTTLFVLDQDMNPVPVGVNGKLFIGGYNLANGYLNNEELTKEKFVPNPFSKGELIYDSGDIVKWLPSGALEYIQRADGQLKIRGNRVEIGEVETQINCLEGVDSGVVKFYKKDEDINGLIGYYTSKSGLTSAELKQQLRLVLPEYMIPTWVFKMDAFPITQNGKVDKSRLPTPKTLELHENREIVAPRNETESAILQMWVDLLKTDHISIDDNFFERGGHSLLAVRLLNRIESKYEVQFEIKSLYENPTIQNISQQLELLLWATSESIETNEENIENYTF